MKFQRITVALAAFTIVGDPPYMNANARLMAPGNTDGKELVNDETGRILHPHCASSAFVWEPYLIYNGAHSEPEMTVLWRASTDTCQICAIEAGSVCDPAVSVSAGTGDLGIDYGHFKHTFSGLSSDTTYYYQVECGSDSIDGSFKTPPGINQDTKILAYGDTRSNPDTHDLLARHMINDDPEYLTLTLHVGDWVGQGRCIGNWDSDLFTPAATTTCRDNIRHLMSSIPFNGCRGNHENSGDCTEGTSSSFATLFDEIFPYNFDPSPSTPRQLFYSFDYGNIHVSELDQYSVTGANSPISSGTAQYDWLANDLDLAIDRGFRWKMVIMHQPIFSARDSSHPLSNDLQTLFESKAVDIVVLAGHDHFYARAEVGPPGHLVRHVTTGGGAAPLYTPQPALPAIFKKTAMKHHYCRMDAQSDYMCFQAIDICGHLIDYFEIGTPPSGYDCGTTGIRPNCPECSTDEDCIDGVFCNGVETCNGGNCTSPGDPCDGRTCDEEHDECVGCANDDHCDDVLWCNGQETCDNPDGTVGNCIMGPEPCPGQACDEDTNVCTFCRYLDSKKCKNEPGCHLCNLGKDGKLCRSIASDCVARDCTIDADCDNGVFCDGYEYCAFDDTCQSSGNPCNEATENCNEATRTCDPTCTYDYDCGSFCTSKCDNGNCVVNNPCPDQFCDEATGDCFDCLTNDDCNPDPPLHCSSKMCVNHSCQDDPNFDDGCQGDCDEALGGCIECNYDIDCNPDLAPFCQNQKCVNYKCQPDYPCNPGETCNEANRTCDPTCTSDDDCGSFCTLNCDNGNCVANNPCPGEFCDVETSSCFQCLSQEDCPDGKFCDENHSCKNLPTPCSGLVKRNECRRSSDCEWSKDLSQCVDATS